MITKSINFKKSAKILGISLLFLTVILQFLHLLSEYLILTISVLSLILIIYSVLIKDKNLKFSGQFNKKKSLLRLIFMSSIFLILFYFLFKDISL
jgi:O-antigen/teichoic acid export membrane protein